MHTATSEGDVAAGGSGQPEVIKEFTIPGSDIGRLIGKKGRVIMCLQQESGARVTVTEQEDGRGFVRISGRLDSVNFAFELVKKHVQSLGMGASQPCPTLPRLGQQRGRGGLGSPSADVPVPHDQGQDLNPSSVGTQVSLSSNLRRRVPIPSHSPLDEDAVSPVQGQPYGAAQSMPAPPGPFAIGDFQRAMDVAYHNGAMAFEAGNAWVASGAEEAGAEPRNSCSHTVTRLTFIFHVSPLPGNTIGEVGACAMCPLCGRLLGRFHRIVATDNNLLGRQHPVGSVTLPFPFVMEQIHEWFNGLCSLAIGRRSSLPALSDEEIKKSMLLVTINDSLILKTVNSLCGVNQVPARLQNLLFGAWGSVCDTLIGLVEDVRTPEEERVLKEVLSTTQGMQEYLGLPRRDEQFCSGFISDTVDDLLAVVRDISVVRQIKLEPTTFREVDSRSVASTRNAREAHSESSNSNDRAPEANGREAGDEGAEHGKSLPSTFSSQDGLPDLGEAVAEYLAEDESTSGSDERRPPGEDNEDPSHVNNEDLQAKTTPGNEGSVEAEHSNSGDTDSASGDVPRLVLLGSRGTDGASGTGLNDGPEQARTGPELTQAEATPQHRQTEQDQQIGPAHQDVPGIVPHVEPTRTRTDSIPTQTQTASQSEDAPQYLWIDNMAACFVEAVTPAIDFVLGEGTTAECAGRTSEKCRRCTQNQG